MNIESIDFDVVSTPDIKELGEEWGEKDYRYFHLDDGFMTSAIY
jgi:hypothetical protein